jgi:Lon protease-like protein
MPRQTYIRAMKLPREIPVMTLPSATLFPQAMLPLYIFEPRYRKMLADALASTRMFSVAMQRPGSIRETPSPIAGLGLIRASVGHRDGTSHLILQGVARVELKEIVRYRPYRIQRIKPLQAPPCDNVRVDALVAKLRELLQERVDLGLPFPLPAILPGQPKEILNYLNSITDPEQTADLVSCAVLPGAADRQTILETVDVESRLRCLIYFLLAEIRNKRKEDAL